MRRGRAKRVKPTGPARCGGTSGDGCGARIVFVKMTATGNKVPVDPIPVDDGNVCGRLVGTQLEGYVVSKDHPPERPYTRYMTHHATCPDRPRAAPKPKPEPAPTLFDDTEQDTCRPVEVDGETIRVHGAAEMDETDRAMFAEIVRAAKRKSGESE